MDFDNYLAKYFPALELKQPLFYNWDYGIRFELGYLSVWKNKNRTILNQKYFKSALYRAKTLYKAIFDINDNIIVVCQRYSDGRQKIKKRSFCYENIHSFTHTETSKTENPYYEEGDFITKKEHWQRKIFYTKSKYVNYKNFLYRSIHYDFGYRGIEVYFINTTKNIIFYNYDDRGLDIIANNPKTLKPLYHFYNDWILDYDKDKIDKIFVNL